MNALADLQHWYQAQCNGEWEHECGVSIDTLDNPGWTVTIDLEGTALQGQPFKEIHDNKAETDWIRCWVDEAKFPGVGDPKKLEQILHKFLSWANAVPDVHNENDPPPVF